MEFWADIADWAWARHHNELSWYTRPLIMLAFCAAAWFRSLIGTIALAVFFPISAVIFPAPDIPKPYVIDFLQKEREMLEGLTLLGWVGFVSAVVIFLWLLAAAFWKRSFWYGLAVANLGALAKLGVSIFLWKDIGNTAILPTITTAVVFDGGVIAIWAWLRNRRGQEGR
ncbi:hypothetical protein [Yoonia sp. BS5-3]|uniref:DUF2127 domain-containing protein n=1 Tax=Yoonia phaeophyticola TaxID=3137369 RepID=A0ABZ2V9H7_9RHOB